MRMTPLTKCPGTVAYMPPEALTDEPEYTDKLDCFSLGVLMIQIITRNFPEPTKATHIVHDPKYPTGRVLVPVPEVERRKRDVDLVDICHPIKPISLNCLKDIEAERPSAQEICHQLAKLKQEEGYSESVQQTQHSEEEHERLKEELQGAQTMNMAHKKELVANRTELDNLRKAMSVMNRVIEELRQQLQDKVTIYMRLWMLHVH